MDELELFQHLRDSNRLNIATVSRTEPDGSPLRYYKLYWKQLDRQWICTIISFKRDRNNPIYVKRVISRKNAMKWIRRFAKDAKLTEF
jgi:hypothetical protein